MSNLETLLTAWLNGGEIPADFKPTSNVEEYLLAILNGVDDDVDPKSRADVLLDAIATKYAGFADGLEELRGVTGMTAHHVPGGDTPEEVAAFLRAINTTALQDLAAKGATGVSDNTTDILWAYEDLPSGGAELNIAYGNTAPEDTTKLWVKTAQPQNVTVDYDIDNGVESVQALTAVLPQASRELASGVVGTKLYIFGGYSNGAFLNNIKVFDTENETVTTLATTLPENETAIGCGVVGTKCYLFGGGRQGNPGNLNTINVFDTTNNTLTTLATTLSARKGNIAVGVVGAKCYLFGGYNGSRLNTIDVFDTETNTLTTLPVTLPQAVITSCVAVGTKCYLFGGSSSGGALNTINVFDTTDNTISTLATTLPSAVEFPNLAAIGSKVYLLGGYDHNTINVFDTTDNTISTLTDTTLTNIGNSACGVFGNKVYILGGWTGSANTNAGEKFTVTFPLNNGDVYLQSDVFKNKFTLVTAPTEVKTGVSAVYVGNAQNEAEYADALLYDGAQWQPIT